MGQDIYKEIQHRMKMSTRKLDLSFLDSINVSLAKLIVTWNDGSKYPGDLILSGLRTLDHESARVISTWQGGRALSLNGLAEIDTTIAECLAQWGQTGRGEILELCGLTNLSRDVAVNLFTFGNGKDWDYSISLDGLRSIPHSVVKIISKWGVDDIGFRWIELEGLRELDEDAAVLLARWINVKKGLHHLRLSETLAAKFKTFM